MEIYPRVLIEKQKLHLLTTESEIPTDKKLVCHFLTSLVEIIFYYLKFIFLF